LNARNFHPISVDIIQQEHEHLSAVIQGMLYFVRAIKMGGTPPDLKVFRAMLYYITEYPEKFITPKKISICSPKSKSAPISSILNWTR
jgi:hypothetical protein